MRRLGVLQRQVIACLNLLLPPACHFCGVAYHPAPDAVPICSACHSAIKPLSARCELCARPFATLNSATHVCETCLRHPPPFQRVLALGRHEDPLKTAIHRLKYRNQPGLANVLGQLLGACLQAAPDFAPPDMILPVPLHHRRLRQRGYNQALEIARPISRTLKAPVARHGLQRLRPTPPQQGLPLRERQRNLAKAFACTAPLTDQRILLLDDVMTTGTTVRECCRTLLAAGARKIEVAVICRA